jgi:DeoR/GlpR family transcriptional regulator of sugar metabolism
MNKKEVSINELSETFHVTTETIRKDVSFLQEKNLLAKKTRIGHADEAIFRK